MKSYEFTTFVAYPIFIGPQRVDICRKLHETPLAGDWALNKPLFFGGLPFVGG